MSAGNSPPNPGQPRRSPTGPPTTSTLRRLGPTLAFSGAAMTGLYLYFSTRSAPAPNPFRTPGVKNIEKAYRGAGATATHTPAYGGTIMGQRDSDNFRGDANGALGREGPPQAKSAGRREFGVSGPNGKEEEGKGSDVGEVQRPGSQQSVGPGKMWNKMKYGTEDQK